MTAYRPPPRAHPDLMPRASELAEKIAALLNEEDVSHAALAIALLTTGIIHQYAEDLLKARVLLDSLRSLKDQILLKAFRPDAPGLQ